MLNASLILIFLIYLYIFYAFEIRYACMDIFINRHYNLALDRLFHNLVSFDTRTRIRVIYCTLIYALATSPCADLCDLRARE